MASQKSLDMSLQLFDKLSKRVSSTMPVTSKGFDSLGNATFTLSADSTLATTEKIVVITCKTFELGTAKDVFGNTAIAYVPTVIQICTEANPAGGAGADILTPVELLPIIAECALTGCIIEWHQTTAGTVPSAAAIVAGTSLKTTFKASQYWGVQSAS